VCEQGYFAAGVHDRGKSLTFHGKLLPGLDVKQYIDNEAQDGWNRVYLRLGNYYP
jgi:hypothetical protein